MSTAKEVLENLARAKGYFHRHEVPRAVLTLAQALKELVESPQIVGRDKQTIQMAVAEMAQLLGRTEESQEHMLEGLLYERGKEKALLKDCVTFYTRMDAASKAEQEVQTQTRKLRMDRLMLRAGKFLAAGRVAEALQQYEEAASLHHDEDIIFSMIGRKLQEAGAHEAALPWLERATKATPTNAWAHLARVHTLMALNRLSQALEACQQGQDALKTNPELMTLQAQVEERTGQAGQALARYQEALGQPNIDYKTRHQCEAGIKRLSKS